MGDKLLALVYSGEFFGCRAHPFLQIRSTDPACLRGQECLRCSCGIFQRKALGNACTTKLNAVGPWCCGQPLSACCDASPFQRLKQQIIPRQIKTQGVQRHVFGAGTDSRSDRSGLGVSCGLFLVSGIAKNACLQAVNVYLGPRPLALIAGAGLCLETRVGARSGLHC